jgi:ParB-like nuclease domain
MMNQLPVRLCPVNQLVPYPNNARAHSQQQIHQIAASIQEFGWTNPILVGADKIIIAGHARLEAERLAGNPAVAGLCLALSDWSAELRMLRESARESGW